MSGACGLRETPVLLAVPTTGTTRASFHDEAQLFHAGRRYVEFRLPSSAPFDPLRDSRLAPILLTSLLNAYKLHAGPHANAVAQARSLLLT